MNSFNITHSEVVGKRIFIKGDFISNNETYSFHTFLKWNSSTSDFIVETVKYSPVLIIDDKVFLTNLINNCKPAANFIKSKKLIPLTSDW